jgi:hypothetical protein
MNVFQERGITHLDLHGVRHHEVKDDVIDFCYQHQTDIPLIIICGNSVNMIKIVSQTLDGDDIKFSSPRFGIIRIEKI